MVRAGLLRFKQVASQFMIDRTRHVYYAKIESERLLLIDRTQPEKASSGTVGLYPFA